MKNCRRWWLGVDRQLGKTGVIRQRTAGGRDGSRKVSEEVVNKSRM